MSKGLEICDALPFALRRAIKELAIGGAERIGEIILPVYVARGEAEALRVLHQINAGFIAALSASAGATGPTMAPRQRVSGPHGTIHAADGPMPPHATPHRRVK